MPYQDSISPSDRSMTEDLSNDVLDTKCEYDESSYSSLQDEGIFGKVQHLISTLKEVQGNFKEMCIAISEDRNNTTTLVDHSGDSGSSFSLLGDCIDSSKTDEAKLNEILNLLHHIAKSLSSYEKSSLVIDTPEDIHLETDGASSVNSDVAKTSKSLLITDNLSNVPDAKVNLNGSNPDPLDAPSSEHSQVKNLWKVDKVSQPFQSDIELTSIPKSDPNESHMFSARTKSLRHEIDGIIERKEALDDRLQMLFLQKCRGRSQIGIRKSKYTKSAIDGRGVQNENFLPCLKEESPKINKPQIIRKSKKKQSRRRDNFFDKTLSHKNLYPPTPAPVKSFDVVKQDSQIDELRHDEEMILGSADDGLSSEINSLNTTIQELVKENQNFYSFFQGIGAQTSKQEILQGRNSSSTADIRAEALPRCATDATDGHLPKRADDLASDKIIAEDVSHSTCDKIMEKIDNSYRILHDEVLSEKKMRNEQNSKLENCLSTFVEKSQNECHKNTQLLQHQEVYTSKLEDRISNLFTLHDELRNNMKNLNNLNVVCHSSTQTPSDRMINETNSHSLAHHESCQLNIKQLVNQNQFLERQLYIAKSQLHDTKRKGSLPNIFEAAGVPAADGRRNSIAAISISPSSSESWPTTEVEEDSCTARSVLCTSYLEDGIANLRDKVYYLEQFMTKQANAGNHHSSAHRGAESNDIDHTTEDKKILVSTDLKDLESSSKPQSLMEEKQFLSKRLEELMSVTQELAYHFKATKEELKEVVHERDELLRISRTTNSENSPDSLLLKLKDQQKRINELENKLEVCEKDLHNEVLQHERILTEKESLQRKMKSTVMSLEEENDSLLCAKNRIKKELSSVLDEILKLRTSSLLKDQEIFQLNTRLQSAILSKESGNVSKVNESHLKQEDSHTPTEKVEKVKQDASKEWQQSLQWLQRCLAEEKLHGRLIEAAEKESAARVAVLQEALKDSGDMYHGLQTKYQRLRKALIMKRAEKSKQKQLIKDCGQKVEELSSTTSAIEDNYKAMLSTLGQNIGIAVDILSSHLFMMPCNVHPCPEFSDDPTFWFAAQCSRLRWLQAQLKKLGLKTWKEKDANLSKQSSCELYVQENEGASKIPSFKSKSFDLPTEVEENVSNISAPPSLCPKEPPVVSFLRTTTTTTQLLDSNVWITLNDAEISLTSQQLRLFKAKTNQFNSLVSILKRERSLGTGNSFAIDSCGSTDPPSCATTVDEELQGSSLGGSEA